MGNLLVYRASAGSGKTHTLVTHYIQWALRFPYAFKHILAITFTHQATQEMKQRVVSYLYGLSVGKQSALQDALCQMGWSLPALQLQSKAVLNHILYQYDDFAITTIDSFFHQIIQSFAEALGLKRNFAIEMDEAVVLEDIIEELMLSSDPSMQQWMVDFAFTKLLSGSTWHIKNDIQQLGETLFKESFKVHVPLLLTALQQKDAPHGFLRRATQFRFSFEEKMAQIGKRAMALLQQEALEPTDFAYGTQGVIGYFLKLAQRKNYMPTKRAILAAQAVENWFTSSRKVAKHTVYVVERWLQPLLKEAIALYHKEGVAYKTAIALSRCGYAFGIVSDLLHRLEVYRSKHNVLFISDIAALLYQIIREDETPFLYEKVAIQFHHFLIDEFQDLSYFQWINIRPLLAHSLAQGYENLLVGDMKQSIYRWRSSDWKILNQQVVTAFPQSEVCTLDINRRSLATIVLFNNYFFSRATQQLTDYLATTWREAAPYVAVSLQAEWMKLKQIYDDLQQKPILYGNDSGHVTCLFLSDGSNSACSTSWKEHAQNELLQWCKQLQEAGVQRKDIAILVRNNREVEQLIHLWHTADMLKITRCPSTLWDFIAIKVLIHTLYYLVNEHDPINKVAWIRAYCHCMEKPSMAWHDILASVDMVTHLLPAAFWEQKAFLQNLSLYTSVSLLIEILFGSNTIHNAILVYFQSVLLDYCAKETNTIAAFLAWWEKKGKRIPLPTMEHNQGIQIMTVHQAKGLEFKAVALPFCDWYLDYASQHSPILWLENTVLNHPFSDFPTWPLRYGTDLKATYYAQAYYLERMQIHIDNLNMLYVAFTRAKEQLYIMAPLPEQVDQVVTTADLLYQSLLQWSHGIGLHRERIETSLGILFHFSYLRG